MGTLQKTNSQKKQTSTTLRSLLKLDSETETFSPESPTNDLLSLISDCTDVVEPLITCQDLKRHNLAHILSTLRNFYKSPVSPLDDVKILSPLISMLASNLFRPIPLPSSLHFPLCCDVLTDLFDESPAVLSLPSWPHLHVLYDILAFVVNNSTPGPLRSSLDNSFLVNLLSLFQSEDPRERDRLKEIYHDLYLNMTGDRSFMRRCMRNMFIHFAFESSSTERHFGMGELLEIWGSIINGFAVPLKEEHRVFLIRVLLPLHKPRGMVAYHRQLSYCVLQFVRKEPALCEVVVERILRYWPVANCPKEVLLIGEMEDLVEIMEPAVFDKLALVFFSRIAKCMGSCNSQVAERALQLWNIEQLVIRATHHIEDVLPAIVETIEKTIRCHWNESVQQQTISVKKMLQEMDSKSYSKCLQELKLRESISKQDEKKRIEKWERLEKAATFNDHRIELANGEETF